MDLEATVADTLSQMGIDAQQPRHPAPPGADLVIEPDGVQVFLQLKRRALVTEEVAARLLGEGTPPDAALLIVADRVTDSGRRAITSHRAGYLDLRGRLALHTDRLLIEADVPPLAGMSARTGALVGKAGLEVAVALLMEPERRRAVRELARDLGRSPSTVSDVLAALRDDGLLDADNTVSGTDLFWQLADRWTTPRTWLAAMPNIGRENDPRQPLGLNCNNPGIAGWALTDHVAAVAYGAPIAVRSSQARDFFVPHASTVRRATTLLGRASARDAASAVRVAPVHAVCAQRVILESTPTECALAHPLFVALDLAQDLGRGRESLAAWTPDERWTRVW